MANRINAYDADVTIPQFKGLMQYGDSLTNDSRYATEVANMETFAGALQPAAACLLLTPVLDSPIETIARLHRRWHTNPLERDLIVGASGGKLYAMLPEDEEWTELEMPEDVEEFNSNVWSWVTYEINPPGSTAPVDVLLISNALDGMYMINGETLAVVAIDTKGKKFGIIERYAERIWGGAIADDPDMLMYSAPYDPTDWEANLDIPEDGAGDIQQPSWDGDSFTGMKAFGNQLIAFKKHRVWRIVGTDPGEYTFKEQFGGGAPYFHTVAVDAEKIFMLGDDGPEVYDGLTVNPYLQEYCCNEWRDMNRAVLDKAAGIKYKGRYYISMPMGASTINNAVLVYNPVDQTWLKRTDVSVEAWLETDDGLFFTSATTPGKLYQWQDDSWETGNATGAATRWVGQWNDLGNKQIVKGSHEMYLLCEVKDAPVTLKISIQTEKKVKTKTYTVQPITGITQKLAKQKRIHFGGTGRRFRVIIETEATNAPECWRILGGIQLVTEVDSD